MKKLLLLCLPVLLLTACIFDKDKDETPTSLTLTGQLSSLDTSRTDVDSITGTFYYQWNLRIDSTTLAQLPQDSADCIYTGYLGNADSATYTNERMYHEEANSVFRSKSLYLSRRSDDPVFTHYRVVFTCNLN